MAEKKHEVIGMNKTDACKWLKDRDIPFRTVREDGEAYMVTCDFVPERVNLTVEKGVITDTHGG